MHTSKKSSTVSKEKPEMPPHQAIQDIYLRGVDPLYINRFIDYLLGFQINHNICNIKDIKVRRLITGILENTKTKHRYHSFAQFYNTVTGNNVATNDISILKEITANDSQSIWSLLSHATEEQIIGFFDQKYRCFLLYRDISKRIHFNHEIDVKDKLTLYWDTTHFELSRSKLTCDDYTNPYRIYELLEEYENNTISDLYYCHTDGTRYLIGY
jgi:hypothetical protein